MNSVATPSFWDTLAYQLLVKTCVRRDRAWIRWWWWPLHKKCTARNRVVRTTIHNREVIVNFGYTYPFVARRYPTFNDPLLQLVAQVRRQRDRPIRFVDIGAAVGDTVLLVHSNCAEMVSEYVCVDGDHEFFAYLQANLNFLPSAKLILRQLARSEGREPSLVRIHSGTASAQGKELVAAAPLDQVLAEAGVGAVDLLKIDVDGFDGEVLAGAGNLLKRDRPAVIFECHPILCDRTGNDWGTAFAALRDSGYAMTAWFTKFGAFSHYCSLADEAAIAKMMEFCRKSSQEDWHYDVVALPEGEGWDWIELADSKFARNRRSPC